MPNRNAGLRTKFNITYIYSLPFCSKRETVMNGRYQVEPVKVHELLTTSSKQQDDPRTANAC